MYNMTFKMPELKLIEPGTEDLKISLISDKYDLDTDFIIKLEEGNILKIMRRNKVVIMCSESVHKNKDEVKKIIIDIIDAILQYSIVDAA